MGLGLARAAGFEPATEFRWAYSEPDDRAGPDLDGTGVEVNADPAAAWEYWERSAAHEHLSGLAVDMDESWAVSTLRLETLRRAARQTSLLVIQDGGVRAFAHRTRTYEHETETGETECWAEYGVGAWADFGACELLMAAVGGDAADSDADRTRVLIPETVGAVSDVALAGLRVADHPDFVLSANLTREFEA